MNSFEIAAIAGAVLLLLLVLGTPIAYALGLVAAGGLYFTFGGQFLGATLESMPYALASQYTFLVVPMFVLMGALCARLGVIGDLYGAAHGLTASTRGGLYNATILSSAGFGAISGSTVVAASVFSRIALPEMRRYGYHIGIAAGCIAAAGTLAAMIPPSLAMVIFGILTSESIGALLLAGVLPGLFTVAVYLVGIQVLMRLFPHWAPPQDVHISWREKLAAMRKALPVTVLAFIVVGGIYGGAFSPSAAGTVGAAGALAIGLAQRRMDWRIGGESLREAAVMSAALFSIVIAGMLFSRFLISTGMVRELSSLVLSLKLGPGGFVWLLVGVYLILGLFIDGVSVMVITLPFLYPIAKGVNIDPIWMGVLVVKLIEIAAITPPVGLNLFAVLGTVKGQVKSGELFRGVVPFILMEMVTLSVLVMFPGLSTWLPSAMLGR